MGNKVFWLCADDYGQSACVSAGIRKAVAANRLSAVSAMTAGPDWPRGARALRDAGAPVEVGLHVDLTYFTPLGLMPRFAPSGRHPSLQAQIAGSLSRALPVAEIRDEILRQMDSFVEHWGEPPAYVDGHQHVHVLPGVRTALFDALSRSGLSPKPWLRDPADRLARILRRPSQRPKAATVAVLASGFSDQARRRGFRLNDGFSGFSGFNPASNFAREFAGFLQATGPRHLVMCHPGEEPGAGEAVPDAAARLRELKFVLSDNFPEALRAEQMFLAGEPIFTPS